MNVVGLHALILRKGTTMSLINQGRHVCSWTGRLGLVSQEIMQLENRIHIPRMKVKNGSGPPNVAYVYTALDAATHNNTS
jgi:hypothetical protein